MGSKNEAKKAPVDIIAKVIETLETLTALKNANQCKAINNPTKANLIRERKETFSIPLL